MSFMDVIGSPIWKWKHTRRVVDHKLCRGGAVREMSNRNQMTVARATHDDYIE